MVDLFKEIRMACVYRLGTGWGLNPDLIIKQPEMF